jgi:starch synthase (maltosyl-transferring)
MFVARAILASTLSANWGIYGPAFELLEHRPIREGSEEYLDSEKYQLRQWDLDDPDSLAPLITRLNEIRRSQPALQHLRTLRFHEVDPDGILCYSKTDPLGVGDPILCVVNVDGRQRHAGNVHVDPTSLGIGIGHDDEFEVHDLLGGGVYRWRGWHNFVDLTPGRGPAHVFAVRRITERDDGHDTTGREHT